MSEGIKNLFIGSDLEVVNAEGKKIRRIYLDSAASTLALAPAQEAAQKLLRYYSNTHSSVHLTARICSNVVDWAQQAVLKFVNGDHNFCGVFMGSGATAPLNRLAQGLSLLRPERKIILLSLMEHHSNDLPHRQNDNEVIHLSPYNADGEFSGIDLGELEQLLCKHKGQVNYVAVTAASNVTGHLMPIYDIAELAHKHGVYIVVDAAQLAAHAQIDVSQNGTSRSIDFLVLSGHKIYTPGSPGVLVAKRDLLQRMEPALFGGGMVSGVTRSTFEFSDNLIEREQAGTVNVPGIFALAFTLEFLRGMDLHLIYQKELRLTNLLVEGLSKIEGVKVYGSGSHMARIGAVSFNVTDVPHELLATVLNDYFGIAVRSGCFCAHPFVREFLLEDLWDIEDENNVRSFQGMVRASLGLYNDESDIATFIAAIESIVHKRSAYEHNYEKLDDGSFIHRNFSMDTSSYFDIEQVVGTLLDSSLSEVQNAL
ncbi:MAG: Cysteine desulfurase [Flavipsychrobacter sp.]|nr:Cysteine desulfurase [Flavipsychrobacter sp.]